MLVTYACLYISGKEKGIRVGVKDNQSYDKSDNEIVRLCQLAQENCKVELTLDAADKCLFGQIKTQFKS